jgi:hypothetical protein
MKGLRKTALTLRECQKERIGASSGQMSMVWRKT